MTSEELKKQLIDKILTIENDNLLREIHRFLDIGARNLDVYRLSDVEVNALNEADEQIKNGKYYSNEEADRMIDEWLNAGTRN